MQYLSFLWLAYFLWLDILRDHECCSIWQNFLYMANVPFYVYITSDGRLDASSFCCCCCEVASVMFDSLRPHRQQPTRLPRPWDSPGKNTGVGCHFLLQCMKVKRKVKSLSHVWLFATPWTAAHQAPLSMGFSRQEYWSGSPLPSPYGLEWMII